MTCRGARRTLQGAFHTSSTSNLILIFFYENSFNRSMRTFHLFVPVKRASTFPRFNYLCRQIFFLFSLCVSLLISVSLPCSETLSLSSRNWGSLPQYKESEWGPELWRQFAQHNQSPGCRLPPSCLWGGFCLGWQQHGGSQGLVQKQGAV